MIKFNIITIFPNIFDSYLQESLISRAQKKRFIKITTHNLRDFADDARGTVDGRPFGGGLGMVLKIEPIYKALKKINPSTPFRAGNQKAKVKVILFTPRGKKFTQKNAMQLAKQDQIIFICGRYEGVDQRVARLADMELSIGDYDLMGGELPAMVVMETVARLIPGVLGKEALLKERITKSGGFIEYEQYTRPEVFTVKGNPSTGLRAGSYKVPGVLLSGDHKKIEAWKSQHGNVIE